jgi:hypothetical protein
LQQPLALARCVFTPFACLFCFVCMCLHASTSDKPCSRVRCNMSNIFETFLIVCDMFGLVACRCCVVCIRLHASLCNISRFLAVFLFPGNISNFLTTFTVPSRLPQAEVYKAYRRSEGKGGKEPEKSMDARCSEATLATVFLSHICNTLVTLL